MFWMLWYWRCIGFILWSGLCRAYRLRRGPGASLLRHLRWRARAEEERPAALPPALASRRQADWQRIDAVLESLRDHSTVEDQAA
jgi:hypothetical protein